MGCFPEVAKQEKPVVKAYLPVDDGLDRRLEELFSALNRLGLNPEAEVSTRAVRRKTGPAPGNSITNRCMWGAGLLSGPPEDYRAVEGELVIEPDPGMAFGCGTHPPHPYA